MWHIFGGGIGGLIALWLILSALKDLENSVNNRSCDGDGDHGFDEGAYYESEYMKKQRLAREQMEAEREAQKKEKARLEAAAHWKHTGRWQVLIIGGMFIMCVIVGWRHQIVRLFY